MQSKSLAGGQWPKIETRDRERQRNSGLFLYPYMHDACIFMCMHLLWMWGWIYARRTFVLPVIDGTSSEIPEPIYTSSLQLRIRKRSESLEFGISRGELRIIHRSLIIAWLTFRRLG